MPDQPCLPMNVSPPRKKKGNPEEVQQSHLFTMLRLFESREPRFKFIHASLNGLPLFGKVLGTAWRTGMKKGIWDVFTPVRGEWEGRACSGLYIEIKATTPLTLEQKEFREQCGDLYAFVVCRTWIDAGRAICSYLGVTDALILEAIK